MTNIPCTVSTKEGGEARWEHESEDDLPFPTSHVGHEVKEDHPVKTLTEYDQDVVTKDLENEITSSSTRVQDEDPSTDYDVGIINVRVV